ncbi:MAG TPA: hypothetical protein VGH43_08670 [Jatrophihabitans sp.]|jgi:hypothetical protein
MASYAVNTGAAAFVRGLIDKKQYVLDSDWGQVQPSGAQQNAYLESHTWEQYANWHLGLTEGAADETKARYAFVCGDFRRVHRTGLIACLPRGAVATQGRRTRGARPAAVPRRRVRPAAVRLTQADSRSGCTASTSSSREILNSLSS